jgi:lipopolysaccharide heptosyltransferase II
MDGGCMDGGREGRRMIGPRKALWRDARSILCVRLDNLGDVLMTTPAIHALKFRGDGAASPTITLLASDSGAEAAAFIPDVDRVIRYNAPWVKQVAGSPLDVDFAIHKQLAEASFDAAVIFTVYTQSPLPAALMCRLAGIPLRLAHCRENPYELLTDWVPDPEPGNQVRHEVQRQIDLVAHVGLSPGPFPSDSRMRFEIPLEARRAVAGWLAKTEIGINETLIVLHPGASAASRRYPAERFAQIARTLTRTRDCFVIVTGSRSERELAETVCAPSRDTGRIWNLAGRATLGELAALIARANLLVSNNTGPVHLASALGTPVVDLYALTNPQHTPWQVPSRVLSHDVPCRNCYKSVCPEGHNRCLTGITIDEVLDAIGDLLGDTTPATNGSPISRTRQHVVADLRAHNRE